MPPAYTLASHAEQTLHSNPLVTVDLLKQLGRFFVSDILLREDLKNDQPEPFVLLGMLIQNEILPEHFNSTLKQLEYFDTRESELLVDPLKVNQLFHQMYDLTCWHFKTYVDDDFIPPALYLPSRHFSEQIAVLSHESPDDRTTRVTIDNQEMKASWQERLEYEFVIESRDNEYYQGQLLNGMKQGKGLYVWSDGTKYTGQWVRDSEHGSGEKLYANGDIYRGEWKEGLFHGYGIYEWKDGSRYEGRWENNLEHGFGIKCDADGSMQRGFWSNGEFVFTEDQLRAGNEIG